MALVATVSTKVDIGSSTRTPAPGAFLRSQSPGELPSAPDRSGKDPEGRGGQVLSLRVSGRILTMDCEDLGLPRAFTVYGEDDRRALHSAAPLDPNQRARSR